MRFWSKTAEYSARCGQVPSYITHHEMGKCVERVFKKISLKLNAASHNNASWYIDTDGFLEHLPSGEACTTRGPPSRRLFYFCFLDVCIYFMHIHKYIHIYVYTHIHTDVQHKPN